MGPANPGGGDLESEEIETLFGAYLHQDMDIVHGGPWGAVQNFASESTTEQRERSARALRRLANLSGDEDGLVQVLRQLGLEYYPTNDGYSSYRTWLTAVADYLEDPDRRADEPPRDAPYPS